MIAEHASCLKARVARRALLDQDAWESQGWTAAASPLGTVVRDTVGRVVPLPALRRGAERGVLLSLPILDQRPNPVNRR